MQVEQIRTLPVEKPLVSFIITYYDLPVRMLLECIESILNLSLRSFEREIIIIDDGSKKSPLNELMGYGDDIIYLRQSNKGLSEARNTGLRMSRGEYIQFIDADDKLIQAPYEHCLDLIRFSHPEMVVFDFTRQPDLKDIDGYDDMEPQSGSEYMLHYNIHGSACGYLFKHALLGELRFTPGILNEDEEFTPLLLLRAETVCVTDAKAYFYRLRPNSIITDSHIRYKIRRLQDTRQIIVRLNELTDSLPVNSRPALRRRVAQLTTDYLYNIIFQTQSRHYLDRKIEDLRTKNLFPLPDHDYTAKYAWFRRMTNSQIGLNLLMKTIPLMKKEE